MLLLFVYDDCDFARSERASLCEDAPQAARRLSPQAAIGKKRSLDRVDQTATTEVDGRSDLYSLGVVGFYALSGKLPFDAPEVGALLAMHITEPAPALHSIAAGVPRKLARAVDRCLTKNPADRFATGEALAEAIARSLDRTKETPAVVRVWLAKGKDLQLAYLFPWVFGALTLGVFVWAAVQMGRVSATLAGAALFMVLVLGGGPLMFHGLFRLYQTRRILRTGYTLDDIRLALRSYAEARREELAFEFHGEPSFFARTVRMLTYAAFGISVACAAVLIAFPFNRALVLAGEVFWWPVGATVLGAAVGRLAPGR